MPLRKVSDLQKTVAAASGVFRGFCSEGPPYHTAEEVWNELKQGDEGARLLFFFVCICAKMKGRVAALKKQSRQGARGGLLF